MGAGKPGDIAYLTAIARPDAALVNNIAPAHLERMGSLLGVADTKAAIYDALPPSGVAVINADDRSEENTSELQSLMRISYAVFCLKKKKTTTHKNTQRESKQTA